MAVRTSETRHISSLLGQRKTLDMAMVGVLSISLLAGVIGFAVHAAWIVAIVVLALGLGFAGANARQDRRELIDRDREEIEITH